MKKCDLRNCDILQLRCKNVYILIRDHLECWFLLNICNGHCLELTEFIDDLKHKDDSMYDVIRIKRYSDSSDAFRLTGMLHDAYYMPIEDWSWSREEIQVSKEVSVKQKTTKASKKRQT